MRGGLKRIRLVLFCLLFWQAGNAAAGIRHEIIVQIDPQTWLLDVRHDITIHGLDTVTVQAESALSMQSLALNGKAVGTSLRRDRFELDPDSRSTLEAHYKVDLSNGPPTSSGVMVGEEGVFLPGGSGWALATPGNVASYELTVMVPLPFRAVATGTLRDESDGFGLYHATFAAQDAIAEPTVFAGRYVIAEHQLGGIRLRTYFPPEQSPLSGLYLERAAEYIDLYSEQIGFYPFDEFSIVASPFPVGYGFAGATYISGRILHLPFIQTRSLAHEVLHNWWGNGVLVDYGAGNWAEGLTTYMADYALAAATPEAAREMRLAWLRDYAALPAERDMPLASFVSKGHDASQVVGYNKTAFVFHMLKQLLGQKTFDRAIRQVWARYRGRPAAWDDLKMVFETESGRDLSWYFQQWIGRAGAPDLAIQSVTVRESAQDHMVAVTLSQAEPTYRLDIPVQVETAAGAVDARIDMRGGTATAEIRVPGRPLALRVDPDQHLFRKLATGEAPPILRDVTLDTNPRTVLAVGSDERAAAAARELAERLLENVRMADAAEAATGESGVLVVALESQLPAVLDQLGLAVPERLEVPEGSARVWTARGPTGTAFLVVAGRDSDAIEALRRPLPHYRRQSYLVFDGARAVDRGVWPAGDSALTHHFN